MKILRILIFGLLVTTLYAHADSNTDPGRDQVNSWTPLTSPDNSFFVQIESFPTNSPGYAEALTPDILALANGLQDDPVKIFNYVHDHIRFVLYYGSQKGAELTLLEQSGNDFDQCALLVSLLNAAGYTNTGYGFGLLEMPYQATNGTANDLQHWLQLSVVNTNWSNTSSYLGQLLGDRGYYIKFDMGDTNDVSFQRIWVTLTIGGTNYLLDPAFKVSEPVTNLVNLASAMGFSSNNVMSAAGGTDTGNYVTNLNEANLRGTLTGYTTNLLNYLENNYPNASVEQVLGGWQIVPSTSTTLSQTLLFPTFTDDNNYPLQTWSSQPTNFMSTFSANFAGTNQTWFFPQLQGQGVSLTFNNTGTASLWLGNSVVMQSTNTGSTGSISVTLGVTHPYGGWNKTNNVPVDTGATAGFDQSMSRPYQSTNANYALMYGFEPSLKWLNAQEQQLDEYLAAGYSNSSPQVVNATLNVMGMEWMAQTELAQELLCQQAGQLSEYHHRVGRMAQEAGHGYYVDVYMQQDETFPTTGNGLTDTQNEYRVFDVSSYIWSALEHGIIEQLQNSNLVAASTVKMLEIANTNGQAVYLATSNNWSTIEGSLTNYGSLISTFASLTSQGYCLLLPQNGANPVAGSGTWTGDGFVELQVTSTRRVMGMIIGGLYNGGYVSNPTAVVNPTYTELTVVNTPTYFASTPVYTPAPATADPVDTADGTFQVEHTDLSLGGSEPRGITLSRYYNGTRRFSNPAGMAGGWIHNYCVTANNVAAPQAGLGETTPAQMASMLVTTYAVMNLYNNTQPDPKNWLVTALIAKWGVDQLTKNGVSVNLGKDTVQFVEQPNGVFTPPANCTMTLIQTNSAYWLQQRHGNTFKFDSLGRLTNIVDQYSAPLNVTYLNSTSSLPHQVTDWKSRTFTFSYNTSNQLTSVSDGARAIDYGYSTAYNIQGDLTGFTDAEGKTTSYTYDTNHEIVATIDAKSQLVVSNLYDGDGHVAIQYTEGNTNKKWNIFWSGWQTVSQDPAGGQQTYFYDDQSRLIGTEDALGNLTQSAYDGQNHIIETVSPLNETNQNFYDGNNNLIQTVDPLGFTNQFIYDANNDLIETIDARGNPTTFGYNSEFSITGQTNGAGDWANYSYTTSGSLAGTLASKTDSGGTTTYGYDSTYGQLTSIAYPNGLGTNTFANNQFGDVTNGIDGRGFATAIQYNNRRELTNSIGPTNLIVKIAYDAVGNKISVTDPRNNASTNSWSPTRMLQSTTLPATAQGTPVVTNIYDNRDWLIASLDPLQRTTVCTNDLTGKLISQTDPLSRTTFMGYDADGRQVAVTNAAGEKMLQQWNAGSELIKLTDNAGHTVLRAYDGAGDQTVLTNRNTNTWHFYFDAANRLTNTVTPLGHSTTVAFNHQGLPVLVTDPMQQVTTNSFDAKGRLTNRVDKVASTLYRYDADDNLTNVSENGSTNVWTYDAYSRVSSYTDVNGNLIQYKYDTAGNLTNLIYPGGRNVFYAYDSNNHLTNVLDWSNRKTSITYDLDGQLTKIVRPNGTYRTIGYDPAGEVTNILEQNSLGFPLALFEFAWNSNSTAQWEFDAPLPHTNAPPTRSMGYNADNQLTSFQLGSLSPLTVSSDADGNLTNAPLATNSLVAYTYDARNRLLNVGGVTNFYDSLNNRYKQTQGTNITEYVINPNSKLPQVLMRIKNGVTNYYIYGAGLLYQITETATTTNTLTYHYDYRGSTIALTDDSGNVEDRFEYSLYATMTYRSGGDDTPFLFNGRYGVQSDPNGLLYMRARYYSPYLCRFINADPSGFSGGLNFYAYANGNPVSYEDPFGLGAVGENVNSSWLVSENSVPNANYTIEPNVNTGPQMGPVGFTPAAPYYDPSLASSYFQTYPNDVAFQQGLQVAVPLANAAAQMAGMVGIGLLTDGAGDFAPALGSLSPSQGRLIQAFSDRFGAEVNVVGSRAAGGGLTSDFDYVIGGNSSLRNSAEYYLPKGPLGTGANGTGVDVFNANLTPLNTAKPYIQFTPGNSPVVGPKP